MPDLTGRIALVTGANTGLGYEVARQLVFANATVMMACRELLPCHAAQRAIALEAGNIPRSCDPNQGASIHEGRRCHAGFGMVEALDLNNLTMVAELVADLAERPEPYNRVDLLVNNAGVAAQYPLELTGDGVEGTFQANYLGHWHLTTGLLPLLERGARATGRRARVVHLTSGAHRGAPAAFHTHSFESMPAETTRPSGRCATSVTHSEWPWARVYSSRRRRSGAPAAPPRSSISCRPWSAPPTTALSPCTERQKRLRSETAATRPAGSTGPEAH